MFQHVKTRPGTLGQVATGCVCLLVCIYAIYYILYTRYIYILYIYIYYIYIYTIYIYTIYIYLLNYNVGPPFTKSQSWCVQITPMSQKGDIVDINMI